MESEEPLTDALLAGDRPPVPAVSDLDRHRREMEQSFERLETTAGHGLARLLKLAVLAFVGLILAAIGSYVLGSYLRDRSDRRRVARQMKVVRTERVVRAEHIIGRRAGLRARRRAALVEHPLSADEAGEIITGVLAEVDA
jgi:hypothetical protein